MKAKHIPNSRCHHSINPEPWLNTHAACDHLGISIPTMRRWIRDDRLKPKRTPTGEYRFKASELDALLD